ncbi:hypothetical protein DPM19_13050 [Actinomadura craniellae]|uniref:Uncharacterized protein n=1 Tax=Actinomadura craniellae TaxID=2231787 RepID=A0A365H754_9ACTN|nr:hypothetical protein [Actinomadura craniellae]RAY14935.1 hypothetical protein DPM19_13050 [Actinomadura craniellae]
MSSPCSPDHAPVGDVGAALMYMDSQLKRIRTGSAAQDADDLLRQLIDSFDAQAANDMIDGTCTLIYLYMQWLRQAHEAHDQDVVEHVVPYVVGTLKMMRRSIRPEGIPTMAGMLIAAAIGLSPTLWRKQYGPWTEAEMTALEATAFLLAEHVNHLAGDDETATRMIAEILATVAVDDGSLN